MKRVPLSLLRLLSSLLFLGSLCAAAPAGLARRRAVAACADDVMARAGFVDEGLGRAQLIEGQVERQSVQRAHLFRTREVDFHRCDRALIRDRPHDVTGGRDAHRPLRRD